MPGIVWNERRIAALGPAGNDGRRFEQGRGAHTAAGMKQSVKHRDAMHPVFLDRVWRVVVMSIGVVGMTVAASSQAPMLELVQVPERGNHRLQYQTSEHPCHEEGAKKLEVVAEARHSA